MKRLPNLSGLVARDEELEDKWKAMLEEPSVAYSDPNRWRPAPDFRPSSFPLCPRRYVIQKTSPPEPDEGSVRMNFYTETGIALHAVVQNAFGRSGGLWGFWQCARPGCGAFWKAMKRPTFSPMTKGKKCRNCGSAYFNYHELRLTDDPINLAMHTDGVLIERSGISILEVKTTDEKKVRYLRACSTKELDDLFHSTPPWFGYLHQATTYAVHARYHYPKKLGKLDRIRFIILSRNHPQDFVCVSVKVPDDLLWQEIRSQIVMTKWAWENRVLPVGFARKPSDMKVEAACRWCDYKDVCLEKKADGLADVKSDALFNEKTRAKLEEVKKRAWKDFSSRRTQ